MRTWSYSIMGNNEASTYWFRYSNFIWSFLAEDEIKNLKFVPDDRIRSLITEHFDDLVALVIEQKSKLAYQVLGVFLMDFGAKMSNAVRALILIHSCWEDEKDQLYNEKDRAERFYYLSEFREAITNYKESIKTKITWETQNQVVEKLRNQRLIDTKYPLIVAPDKTSIDYHIKECSKK